MKGPSTIVQSASFVAADIGTRFRLVSEPADSKPRGTVVFVPPFAEEMNKSRRMVARMARLLAADGWRVVQRDLHGCGDSGGDFGDASWSDWLDDIDSELSRALDDGPVWLWCLRAGALLAPALLAKRSGADLLLWQPVVSGRTHLVQFLRLKLAGGMVSEEERVGTKHLLERISRGESIDVAGYKISPALANGLATAELAVPAGYSGRVVWLEVVAADAGMPPAAQATMTSMTAAGARVDAATVRGPSFWQSVELEDCPELTTATLTSFAMRDGIELDRRTAVL